MSGAVTTEVKARVPDKSPESSRIPLWLAISATFLVVHAPADTVAFLSRSAAAFVFRATAAAATVFGSESAAAWMLQDTAVRLKHILFLISLIILCRPLAASLKRAEFLWDSGKLKRRLILSGSAFACLAILVFPRAPGGAGYYYATMSNAPFEAATGWYYRRLLMPAIAHFLGFDGQAFYFVYSLVLTFALIFFVAAYFEREGVRLGFLSLLSISTSGFIIFNFMLVGFAEPLMFILLVLLLFAADTDESRLSGLALSLAAHEGSVFVLVPLILFVFPRKQMLRYFAVIALYCGIFMASWRLDALTVLQSQFAADNRIGIDWAAQYPWRAIGGWFLSYKLLWLTIAYAVYRMIRAGDWKICMAAVSMCAVAPLFINILALDTYRHVSEGFCGLLICHAYLARSGHGAASTGIAAAALNLAVPSLYVGLNNGFRFAPGLYTWLCNVTGLQGWLSTL